jgi:hypothetical protein
MLSRWQYQSRNSPAPGRGNGAVDANLLSPRPIPSHLSRVTAAIAIPVHIAGHLQQASVDNIGTKPSVTTQLTRTPKFNRSTCLMQHTCKSVCWLKQGSICCQPSTFDLVNVEPSHHMAPTQKHSTVPSRYFARQNVTLLALEILPIAVQRPVTRSSVDGPPPACAGPVC